MSANPDSASPGRASAFRLRTGFLAAVASLAMATSALASGLSATTQAKIVDRDSGWAQAFAEADAHVPIIVDFRMPALPDRATFASDADMDAAHKTAVRGVQDQILSGILGGADGIDAAQSSSDVNLKLMPFSPQFAMQATRAQIEAIAANPQVERIHEDRIDAPLLNRTATGAVGAGSLARIQMPAALNLGATGNGWRVAVLDTGSRRSHEFLSNSVSHAACFSSTMSNSNGTSFSLCPGGAAKSTHIDSANDCDSATIAGCGHGTHVAGTAAGFNTSLSGTEPAYGVARDAKILAINVFSRFPPSNCGSNSKSNGCALTWNSDQISALNYVRDQAAALKIASVNMSLGGGRYSTACTSDSRRTVIQQLRNAGVATVIAAGNDGYDFDVSAPGCIPEAITVAASTKDGQLPGFTNWGNLVDVVAPGVNIYASVISGSSNTTYGSMSGTSMATPHVAGVFAAIRSRLPNASVTQIENALKTTGSTISWANIGKPDVRVASALSNLGVTTPPIASTSVIAAVNPLGRRGYVGGPAITTFGVMLNGGSVTATNCRVERPSDGLPYSFAFAQRIISGGNTTLGPTNQPVNIPAGGEAHFLLGYVPTSTMSARLGMVFRCDNTPAAAPVYLGVNTFSLVVTQQQGADMLAIAANPGNADRLRIPATTGGGNMAAMVGLNIGQTATLTARLSTVPLGGTGPELPLKLSLCRTNIQTGNCLAGATSSPISFQAPANEFVSFTAFVNYAGTAIANDAAKNRVYIHFEQGGVPVGSAAVAVHTVAPGTDETAALAD